MFRGFNAFGGLRPSIYAGLNAFVENFETDGVTYGVSSGPLDHFPQFQNTLLNSTTNEQLGGCEVKRKLKIDGL